MHKSTLPCMVKGDGISAITKLLQFWIFCNFLTFLAPCHLLDLRNFCNFLSVAKPPLRLLLLFLCRKFNNFLDFASYLNVPPNPYRLPIDGSLRVGAWYEALELLAECPVNPLLNLEFAISREFGNRSGRDACAVLLNPQLA